MFEVLGINNINDLDLHFELSIAVHTACLITYYFIAKQQVSFDL